MEELYETRFLQPSDIQLQRSSGGILQGEIMGDMYREIIIYQAFPFTKPAQYISIRTSDGEELGIIEELSELDSISKSELEKELHLRYLIPEIKKIKRIRQEPGRIWVCDIVTDRGDLSMLLRNLHEHVVHLHDRILLTDIDGLRCEIPDINRLDFSSLKELRKIM